MDDLPDGAYFKDCFLFFTGKSTGRGGIFQMTKEKFSPLNLFFKLQFRQFSGNS